MASSEDFRQQLKAGKLQEAFAGALAQAVQLKITTWVADDAEENAETATQPGYRLQTKINTIEGAIANEVGDQFIGNGPYRDLLPFHLDQVAHGNQLVENNLKSLQKLFEILVALQRQRTGLNEIDYPQPLSLPPTETAAPPQGEVAPVANELTAQTPDLTTQEIQEEISPLSTPPLSTPSSETTTAWDQPDEDEEEDEDDSVLDLLESLPPPPPPPDEDESSIREDEDARDEFEEAEPEPEPPSDRAKAELDEEDWQVLNEDWGTFELEELESSPSPEPDIPSQTDDIELTPREPESAKKMPSLESLEELNQDTDDDTDWDDWVVDEPELGDRSFAQMETDDDWGDLVEDFDPFAAPPPVEASPSELNIQEDWDEFAVEELEPYSDLPEVDSEIEWSDLSDSQTDQSTSDPLEGLGALSEESQEKELTSESYDPIDLLEDQNQSPENVDEPDYEFEELSLDEFAMDDFNPLSHPEEDWKEKPKSTQKGEPPPPPPSPFQDKNQDS